MGVSVCGYILLFHFPDKPLIGCLGKTVIYPSVLMQFFIFYFFIYSLHSLPLSKVTLFHKEFDAPEELND